LESNHRIGIIDDDPAVRDSMHLLLEAHGFQVSEYASATDYLKNPNADCLLLIDLAMPDLNGMDLIDLLRGGAIDTPVILLTDIADPKLSSRISAAGRCARLDKPVTAGALLDRIVTSMGDSHCTAVHT
jgi:two-component system response regulator FixJ